jgi:4-hydroxymandelate oxidase
MDAVVTLAEFEPLARAVMEPAAFDYVAGGAWDEITLADNVAAWQRQRLRPRVLVDVTHVDPATTMLGHASSLPLAIAPMATHGLAHPDAELASARAAAAAGVPYTLSTTSSRSIEEVAAAVPDGIRWFQLYVQAGPAITRSLVERAEASGYRAIVLTVDLPVLGHRDRDRRNGFTLPSLGNFSETPATHGNHVPGTLTPYDSTESAGLSWRDLAVIRSWSSLPLVVKGIMTAEDALLAIEHGVDAIVVSNHGARQLDRVQATVDAFPGIAAAVAGRTELWIDGGVRRGVDLAIARALGAQGVLLGRPVFWALAAGGQAGVERALAIVREEFEVALALLGTPTPADIGPSHLVGGVAEDR